MGHLFPADPAVSVVMPVRDGKPYLAASMASVLGQTFTDFELVAYDDASTDGSTDELREWARRDARVRVFRGDARLGLAGSSNRVVSLARAPLVARMDADDVCHPERLERQVEVFRSQSGVSLLGTLFEGIDAHGRDVRPRDRWRLVRRSSFAPFPHGSVMFPRALFLEVGGYRGACEFWEDLDLYFRLAGRGRVLVLPEALYVYRFHFAGCRFSRPPAQVERAVGLMFRCIAERCAGRPYEPLLERATAGAGANPEPLDPYALFLLAAPGFWAGGPLTLLSRLAEERRVPLTARSLAVAVVALWGALAPSSLRAALRALIRVRDRAAGWYVRDGQPFEWRFE